MAQLFLKARGWLLAVVATLVALSSLFLLNIVQVLSFVILPFSRKMFRLVNTTCAALWWSVCYYFGKVFFRTNYDVRGDALPVAENAIVVANHQMMPDVFVLFHLALRSQMLKNLKWFAKASLKYVPGMGWGLWCIDTIFLDRNWEADREKVKDSLRAYRTAEIPIWLVAFPEGTRITPEKLEQSKTFSRKHSRPVLERVLLPRTKGFVTSVQGLREHCRAVYVLAIHYNQGVSSLWKWLMGLGGSITVDVRRFEMNTLPESDSALSDWLVNRFQEMDIQLKELAISGRTI